jgi:hypothetical protein
MNKLPRLSILPQMHMNSSCQYFARALIISFPSVKRLVLESPPLIVLGLISRILQRLHIQWKKERRL